MMGRLWRTAALNTFDGAHDRRDHGVVASVTPGREIHSLERTERHWRLALGSIITGTRARRCAACRASART